MRAFLSRHKHLLLRLLWIVGLIAVTVAVVIAARHIDWHAVVVAAVGVSPLWLAVAVAANTSILICWSAFWMMLAPTDSDISYRTMFEISAVASSVMNTIPFLAGHATGVALLVKRAGLKTQAALSLIAMDQLGEGVVKVLVCIIVALFAPLPGWIHTAFVIASAVVAALLVALTIVAHTHGRWGRYFGVLRNWRRASMALALVAGTKVMEGLGIFAAQHAFRLSFGFPEIMLVLAAVLLATAVPFSPGNLGPYEAAAFFAYRYLGLASETALALAIVQHLCFMASSVGVGYLLGARRALRG